MRQRNGMFVLGGFFVLVLLISGLAIAGVEPPGGEEKILDSPYIRGILTITPGGEYMVDGTLLGVCRKNHRVEPVKRNFCGIDTGGAIDFSAITAADLLNYRLYSVGIQDCLTKCGYFEDLIITEVLKFRNSGNKIWADVIMKYVVPASYPD